VLRVGEALGVRSPLVVADGVRPLEAFLGEAFLEGQLTAGEPELDVVLTGDDSELQPLDHRLDS